MKRYRLSTEENQQVDRITNGIDGTIVTEDELSELSKPKKGKEKERQKKKKKRQKAEKQAKADQYRRVMEERASRAEAEDVGPMRFLVGMPLENVKDLSGRSVCRHFRKRDLSLNDILPVSLDSLFTFSSAKALYDSLQGPIYFVRYSCSLIRVH